MRAFDTLAFALRALASARLRSFLILLAMSIGVGGVVVLTWLGDAARLYVVGQFSSLGSELVIVLPGRSETKGAAPPILGETPRDLTLQDALSLLKYPSVRRVAPVIVGDAPVAVGRYSRQATVLGTTPSMFEVRHLRMAQGRTWSDDNPERAQAVCVLGATLRRELFRDRPVLGEWVRIGERRFRVIGTLASEGRSLGTDLDEIAVVPVASAAALFDSPALFRILVEAQGRESLDTAVRDVETELRVRHDGEEDVTVITQEAVLGTFDNILGVLTAAVGGIASISLLVAGILIMNVMVVAVAQRREEVGLLKALGASQRRIRDLFLTEAAMLALLGAGVGLLIGQLTTVVMCRVFPVLEPGAPWWSTIAAPAVALLSGVGFGLAPARRAARLEPVEALSKR